MKDSRISWLFITACCHSTARPPESRPNALTSSSGALCGDEHEPQKPFPLHRRHRRLLALPAAAFADADRIDVYITGDSKAPR